MLCLDQHSVWSAHASHNTYCCSLLDDDGGDDPDIFEDGEIVPDSDSDNEDHNSGCVEPNDEGDDHGCVEPDVWLCEYMYSTLCWYFVPQTDH